MRKIVSNLIMDNEKAVWTSSESATPLRYIHEFTFLHMPLRSTCNGRVLSPYRIARICV